MDILYILGSGSGWQNNELRYSLRSLDKHAKGIDRVFLTGENPGFLNDKIIYNYQPDPRDPAHNHLSKVLWTIKNTDISENFMMQYDDNYLTKDIEVKDHPYYYKGELPSRAITDRPYRHCLINTHNYLKEYSYKIKDFGVHCPIIYNKKKFLGLKDAWDHSLNIRYGMSVRAIYCNMNNVPAQFMSDAKVKNTRGEDNIRRYLQDKSFFSLHDKCIHNGMNNILAELYPHKSRWEL